MLGKTELMDHLVTFPRHEASKIFKDKTPSSSCMYFLLKLSKIFDSTALQMKIFVVILLIQIFCGLIQLRPRYYKLRKNYSNSLFIIPSFKEVSCINFWMI